MEPWVGEQRIMPSLAVREEPLTNAAGNGDCQKRSGHPKVKRMTEIFMLDERTLPYGFNALDGKSVEYRFPSERGGFLSGTGKFVTYPSDLPGEGAKGRIEIWSQLEMEHVRIPINHALALRIREDLDSSKFDFCLFCPRTEAAKETATPKHPFQKMVRDSGFEPLTGHSH